MVIFHCYVSSPEGNWSWHLCGISLPGAPGFPDNYATIAWINSFAGGPGIVYRHSTAFLDPWGMGVILRSILLLRKADPQYLSLNAWGPHRRWVLSSNWSVLKLSFSFCIRDQGCDVPLQALGIPMGDDARCRLWKPKLPKLTFCQAATARSHYILVVNIGKLWMSLDQDRPHRWSRPGFHDATGLRQMSDRCARSRVVPLTSHSASRCLNGSPGDWGKVPFLVVIQCISMYCKNSLVGGAPQFINQALIWDEHKQQKQHKVKNLVQVSASLMWQTWTGEASKKNK